MQFLSPGEVARLFEVSTETIRRWVLSGKLPAHRAGMWRVFDLADVQALAEQRRAKRRLRSGRRAMTLVQKSEPPRLGFGRADRSGAEREAEER